MPLSPISPSGVGTAFIYAQQVSQGPGISAAIAANPGVTNAPIIFEPNSPLSGNALNVFMIATGQSLTWGGCQVWMSPDNISYAPIGIIYSGQVQGILSAAFASGSDPDTSNTLLVDLTRSNGQLLSVGTIVADDFLNACYVDGELISYTNATLTSAFNYSLGTYLRRGLFSTAIGSHAAGTQFGLITDSTFRHRYLPNLIGSTIYIKLPAFSFTGSNVQPLSSCVPYAYTLTGQGVLGGTAKIRRIAQGSTITLSTATDYIIEVITGSLAPTTINGPTGALILGERFEIHDKNNNAGTYPMNFVPQSPQTVEGQTSYSETISNGTLVVTWDGVEWSAASYSD